MQGRAVQWLADESHRTQPQRCNRTELAVVAGYGFSVQSLRHSNAEAIGDRDLAIVCRVATRLLPDGGIHVGAGQDTGGSEAGKSSLPLCLTAGAAEIVKHFAQVDGVSEALVVRIEQEALDHSRPSLVAQK